jgi:NADPH:quinone reductase-like Zn-dependent oxidoreductase
MKVMAIETHGGPEVLRPMEVRTPEPDPGEVRVAVHACALNHLDIFVRRGIPGLALPLPHVGGSDIAGTVDAVGEGVERWTAGDRVIVNPGIWAADADRYSTYDSLDPGYRIIGEHVWGGFAEFVVVPSANLVRLPDPFSFTEGAAVPLALQTAWRALFARARLRAGETILIPGASGGVAVAAIQLAKLAGAIVYAITSGEEKVARVSALGADRVFDRLRGDPFAEIRRATENRGVDVVLENVGAAMWKGCIRSLRRGGRLVTYGATAGSTGEIDIPQLFWKQITIMGSTMASHAEFLEAIEVFIAGKIKPVVSHTLPLDELRRAHEILERGEQFGKVVVTVR